MKDEDDTTHNNTNNNKRKGKGNDNQQQQQQQTSNSKNRGPRTENEIDIYNCTTYELEKLNVGIDPSTNNTLQMDSDGAIIINENIKHKLQIAGTLRSYIPEQRTVVVDSFIPVTLLQHGSVGGSTTNVRPLDEGSMLVIITKQEDIDDSEDESKKSFATTLDKVDESSTCSIQRLGKIIEVFGPISRPLYAIKLPDPPAKQDAKNANNEKKAKANAGTIEKVDTSKVDDDEVEMKEEESNMGEESSATQKGGDTNAEMEDKSCNGGTKDDTTIEETNENQNDTSEPPTAFNEVVKEDKDAGSNSSDDEKKSIPQQQKTDPWSVNGKLSTILKSHPNAAVYVLKDHAKLIDTDQIIRVSGKGCDASNMYDEEPGQGEHQYYSDDEQERNAKRGNRKPRQQTNDNDLGATQNAGSFQVRGGRGGRGRGGRGGRSQQYHNNSFGSTTQHQHMQPPQYQQQHYPQQQQLYHNQYPSPQQMAPNNNYPYQQQRHANPPYQQQGMYPQQQQQQQQLQYQPQYQPVAYGEPQTYQYPPQQGHGMPAHPPPQQPGSNVAPQMMYAQHYSQPPQHSQPPQQASQPRQQQQNTESDTVYYDYSGA